MGEGRLRENSQRIVVAYKEVASDMGYGLNCNVASAVASHFLKREGIKTRIHSFLYMGENPNTPDELRTDADLLAK